MYGGVGLGLSFCQKIVEQLKGEIWVESKENRMLLKTVMNNFGFVSYPKEWWHFTLYNEPYKNQYFDFVVD